MVSSVTGAREFAATLQAAGDAALPAAQEVIKIGSQKLERQLQKEMRASPYFKGQAKGITHDVTVSGGTVTGEIGPETGRGRPGALSGIAYFGGANGGGGTVRDPELALAVEAPIVEKHLLDVVFKDLQ